MAALVMLSLAGACKEQGGVKVTGFTLVGVHAFSEKDILKVLATQKTGWIPGSTPQYFDRADFEADLKRIQAFYTDHGYPHVRVTDVKVDVDEPHQAVKLNVTIDEGTPVIVDDVRFRGFEVLDEGPRNSLKNVPLKAGAVRDRDNVKATRDVALQLLNNGGYPEAYIDAAERPNGTPDHVIVSFRADPGPPMKFGDVSIDGLKDVDEDVVRREVAFKTGATFKSGQVVRTQHRLSRLEVFQVVSVTPRTEEAKGDAVPVRITVAEGPPRQLKLGLGYGSEEHARATFNWRHVNFYGGARQAEVDAKLSSIDQGFKFSILEPYLRRPGLELEVTGTVWRTHQLTYDSQTYGGRVTLGYHHETRLGEGRPIVRYHYRVAYVHEYLRYGITQAGLEDQSSRLERIALGLDPVTGRGAGTLAALDFDAERNVVDSLLDPHRGLTASVHFEHAAPWVLGSYRFDEVGGDLRSYIPVGSAVLALRAHAGSVYAGAPSTLPFSKLYFLGGAMSERGWGRFEISPLDSNGLPVGGRTFAETSAELRVPLTPKITVVGFVDAGDVKLESGAFRALTPRTDVGAGLRYNTQIGVVRVDYGYQLNPIPGLVINGNPEVRHWRIHFSIGQAF
jgi:outer membrane protein assembly complex protein YaeT